MSSHPFLPTLPTKVCTLILILKIPTLPHSLHTPTYTAHILSQLASSHPFLLQASKQATYPLAILFSFSFHSSSYAHTHTQYARTHAHSHTYAYARTLENKQKIRHLNTPFRA
ncbi:hypothetical protein DL95DRAFT_105770 [Leptodontidium sp. 2 PMI_412]|nr:hypothetical protein DL95DRAFT_105770 [Leptodontidium sp. 2 PMI_412]